MGSPSVQGEERTVYPSRIEEFIFPGSIPHSSAGNHPQQINEEARFSLLSYGSSELRTSSATDFC